jgi:pilus assembly protein FimV
MIKKCSLGTLVLGGALIAAHVDVSALTLGRVRGAVLIGQTLDVTVPVQVAADEDVAQACFDADVFYGDNRLASDGVTVSVTPAANAQTAVVRVRASSKVDEPVVSVYLKSTCGQKTSRRYVLLSDLASELVPNVVTPALVPFASTALAVATPEASTPKSPTGTVAKVAKAVAVLRVAPRQSTHAKAASAEMPGSRKARLKLAPLDMSPERDPVLKSSSELISSPVEDLQKRVEALAMWRALNASAQDVLRDEARLQSMEGDLKHLGDVTSKNRQSLQEVTSRLEQAELQRYANPLVYALAVGLMACLAALVFLWQRLRSAGSRDTPWWGASQSNDGQSMLREDLADVQGPDDQAATQVMIVAASDAEPVLASPTAAAAAPIRNEHAVDIDIDLELGESLFAPSITAITQFNAGITTPAAPSPNFVPSHSGDFQHSNAMSPRAINTKEMLDVRQQADFFMTLGQYEDAIGLLENSIKGAPESNPLVYLDLLKLLHTLSRKAEFDKYRDEFNHLFTGLVPPYAGFNRIGNGIDTYPDICEQIAALWPKNDALHFIEHCLVRTPVDATDQGFSLEAFRELLMLHAVATRLNSDAESGFAPFSAQRNSSPGDATSSFPSVPLADGIGAGTMLDVDLSDHSGNLIDFDISLPDPAGSVKS